MNAMIDRANYRRAHQALHKLWTLYRGMPAGHAYDKSAWRELEAAIYMLATDGPGPVVSEVRESGYSPPKIWRLNVDGKPPTE